MSYFESFQKTGVLYAIGTSMLLSACATPGQGNRGTNSSSLAGSLGSFGQLDYENNNTRRTAGVESSVGLFAKTTLMDPVVRPVSTVKALYGLVIKSAGGFVERTFIERVRMPSLARRPLTPISHAVPMNIETWEKDLDELTSTKRTSGNIRFLVDGEEYFNRLTEVIEQAEQSIDIRTYIFDNDDVALKMANLLREKSEATEVRILVDGLADLFATRLDSASMPDDLVLPSSISEYLTYESEVEFRKQSNPWFTGDHVKITVVDGNRAFLGGMNIGREYRHEWHDLMMELDGPVVARLQFEFDKAWVKSGVLGDFGWLVTAIKGYPREKTRDGIPLRILTTTIHNSQLYRAQVAAIRRARNRIYIENAYFSDDKILYELAKARRRGVDVRVILSSETDSGVLSLSNHKAINSMLKHGIRVYSYPGMTHLKAAVYDGWACLGSANFDKLSLQINQEINLGFSDPETVEQMLHRVFYPDFAAASELREPLRLATRHHLAEMIADELF